MRQLPENVRYIDPSVKSLPIKPIVGMLTTDGWYSLPGRQEAREVSTGWREQLTTQAWLTRGRLMQGQFAVCTLTYSNCLSGNPFSHPIKHFLPPSPSHSLPSHPESQYVSRDHPIVRLRFYHPVKKHLFPTIPPNLSHQLPANHLNHLLPTTHLQSASQHSPIPFHSIYHTTILPRSGYRCGTVSLAGRLFYFTATAIQTSISTKIISMFSFYIN